MEISKATNEKIEKTLKRLQKAAEYDDKDYMKELLYDLAEFSYFEGYKQGERSEKYKEQRESCDKIMQDDNIESKVSSLIFELGVPAHIKGYRYLTEAVTLVYRDFSIQSITKELYPQIAKKYDTTSSRVERAIRHAIGVGWSRGDMEVFSALLGKAVTKTNTKPTNSEYIYLIADYMRRMTNNVVG